MFYGLFCRYTGRKLWPIPVPASTHTLYLHGLHNPWQSLIIDSQIQNNRWVWENYTHCGSYCHHHQQQLRRWWQQRYAFWVKKKFFSNLTNILISHGILLDHNNVMWHFYHASLPSFAILTNPDHFRFHPLTPDLDLNICGLSRIFC